MPTLIELNSEDKERLCFVARALSVPARIDIISLLYQKPLSILEVANSLGLPASTVGLHIHCLEEAGIIVTERVTVDGARVKICHVEKYLINIILRSSAKNVNQVTSLHIPLGSYSNCEAVSRCGLISGTGFIGTEDDMRSFFLLERIHAQLIWMASGFLEYRLPNILPKYKKCKKLSISMELCSEAPGYDEKWESRIGLSLNGLDCGCYHALGDYGSRRGIYTPEFWQNGLTQYGKLATWTIDQYGVFVNMSKVADVPIEAFRFEDSSHILMRVEARDQGEGAGGLNLFGEGAGDYNQPIVLSVEH